MSWVDAITGGVSRFFGGGPTPRAPEPSVRFEPLPAFEYRVPEVSNAVDRVRTLAPNNWAARAGSIAEPPRVSQPPSQFQVPIEIHPSWTEPGGGPIPRLVGPSFDRVDDLSLTDRMGRYYTDTGNPRGRFRSEFGTIIPRGSFDQREYVTDLYGGDPRAVDAALQQIAGYRASVGWENDLANRLSADYPVALLSSGESNPGGNKRPYVLPAGRASGGLVLAADFFGATESAQEGARHELSHLLSHPMSVAAKTWLKTTMARTTGEDITEDRPNDTTIPYARTAKDFSEFIPAAGAVQRAFIELSGGRRLVSPQQAEAFISSYDSWTEAQIKAAKLPLEFKRTLIDMRDRTHGQGVRRGVTFLVPGLLAKSDGGVRNA